MVRIGGQYLIEKGSVTLDGVSLTVVSPRDTAAGTEFEAHIIPHTWSATNLSARAAGEGRTRRRNVSSGGHLVKPANPRKCLRSLDDSARRG